MICWVILKEIKKPNKNDEERWRDTAEVNPNPKRYVRFIKAPIATAADDKLCDVLLDFIFKEYNVWYFMWIIC